MFAFKNDSWMTHLKKKNQINNVNFIISEMNRIFDSSWGTYILLCTIFKKSGPRKTNSVILLKQNLCIHLSAGKLLYVCNCSGK